MRKLFLAILILSSQLSYAEEGKPGVSYVPFEPFVVNLKDDAYVSFTPQLKLAHPEDQAYVQAYVPAVRHELIKQMMGQAPAAVRTPDFIANFAKTALDIANRVIGEGYVRGVFFTSWVVQ